MLPKYARIFFLPLLLALFAVACGARQGEPSPTATAPQPPADAQAIRDVDISSVPEVQTLLRQITGSSLPQREVTYADLTGDLREEAIVPLSAMGSLGNVAYVVLTLDDGKPRPVLTRTAGREGGGLRMEVEDSALVELAPEYGPEDPFCCPSVLRKTYFRWDGSQLQVKGEQRLQQPRGPKF